MALPDGITAMHLPEYSNRHENFSVKFKTGTCFNMRLPFPFSEHEKNYRATTKNFQWLIKHAIDNNISLRAIGAGWSFTEVAMADGIVDTLELRDFFRVQDSFIDPAYLSSGKKSENLVFTQCGIDIQQLHKELEEENGWMKCLRASGASNGQTIAGATSTGTHGSAYKVGAVHDTIIGMHIITGPDKHVWIQKASNPVASQKFITWLGAELISNDDMFNAAVVSFGSFGFIHGLLIETEPIFLLEKHMTPAITYNENLKLAINNQDFSGIQSLLPRPETGPGAELYHFEILVNPHKFESGNPAKGVFMKTIYKIPYTTNYTKPINSTAKFQYGDELLDVIQTILDAIGPRLTQKLIPPLVGALLPQAYPEGVAIKGTMGEIFTNTLIRGKAASAALAIDSKDACRVIEEIVKLNKKTSFAGAIALRFVKGTSAMLGFTKFQKTCVLEMDGVESKSSRNFFKKIWDRLDELNIPYTLHWGKVNHILDAPRIRKMYGDATVNKWIISRKKLLEPPVQKVFTNNFMRNCGLT